MGSRTLHIELMRGFATSDLRQQQEREGHIDVARTFWRHQFDMRTVRKDVGELSFLHPWQLQDMPQLLAVKQNPELYIQSFQNAIDYLRCGHFDNRHLFAALETLQIACHMHTIVESEPFELSLAEGYVIRSVSSRVLLEGALSEAMNPYLQFLRREVFPLFEGHDLERVVLHGKPDICAFALAEHVKRAQPQVAVVLHESDSDYYSLFKIADVLQDNFYFWSCFDAVYDFPGQRKMTSSGVVHASTLFMSGTDGGGNDCSGVCDLRLFPKAHCPWCRCAFCGINARHGSNGREENVWDVEAAFAQFVQASSDGRTSMWAIDEAIPASVLKRLSKLIVSNSVRIEWHVRTRLERTLVNEGTIALLEKAGIRHIIVGLESASWSVLRRVHKTDDEDYLNLLESFVSLCQKHAISVHCPCIIGFPFETSENRDETVDFLQYMITSYASFSFNINLFYLDIASPMFRSWASYGMVGVSLPCASDEFLGNAAEFQTLPHQNVEKLVRLRDATTDLLYPWHPGGALLSSNDYYGFMERSRLSFVINQNDSVFSWGKASACDSETFKLAPTVGAFELGGGAYGLYDFSTHQRVEGFDLVAEFVKRPTEPVLLSALYALLPEGCSSHVDTFVSDMFNRGLIVAADRR